MSKKIVLTLLTLISLMLVSSCSLGGSRIEMLNNSSEDKKADARMEQVIEAIKAQDADALKALFSKKALDEADDIDGEMDALLDFIQGDITSWKRDSWASDGSMSGGKKSLMIRFGIDVVTDVEEYSFFIIDYNTDTIDPDNEGVYMLEVSKSSYTGEWESWQKRMCAGISIVE